MIAPPEPGREWRPSVLPQATLHRRPLWRRVRRSRVLAWAFWIVVLGMALAALFVAVQVAPW